MEVITGDARSMDLSAFQQYQVILADPPWWYADQKKVRKDTKVPTRGIGACHHYSQMTTDELCDMPIKSLQADRCLLFLWATCPLLPDALQVMDAWGFDYSTVAFVWIKLNAKQVEQRGSRLRQMLYSYGVYGFLDKLTVFGPGYYTGSNAELVLLGRRKGAKSIRHGDTKLAQVVYSPRLEHSQKPDQIQDSIERMYPDAMPRLELFARRPREGWDVFGNEVGVEDE